jgi:hypothetical protein
MLVATTIEKTGETPVKELEALGKANAAKIMAPVEAGALAGDWDLQPLRALVQGMTDREIVRHALVFHSKLVLPHFIHECMENLYCSIQWNGQDMFRDNIPMWAWRSLIEVEGINRDVLPAKVNITTVSPFEDDDPKPRKSSRRKRRPSTVSDAVEGRTSGDVKDPEERARIHKDYEDGLSYIDLEAKYGLRPTNGMNAYRIVVAVRDELAGAKKKKAKKKKSSK